MSRARRGPGSGTRDLAVIDGEAGQLEDTEAKGHCPQRRRPRNDLAALHRAVRLHDAAWRDFLAVVAHLTLAGRTTCGRDGDFWAREQLRRWIDGLDDTTLHALADALAAEADAVRQRLRRSGRPR